MIPGKAFKLSKTSKRIMATLGSAEQRSNYKRAMIQAELAGAVVIKREPRVNK